MVSSFFMGHSVGLDRLSYFTHYTIWHQYGVDISARLGNDWK